MMKKMLIVVATFGLMLGMNYHNEQEAKIAQQEAMIQQLQESNAAYYEGMNGFKSEVERLERVNSHYASVMVAK